MAKMLFDHENNPELMHKQENYDHNERRVQEFQVIISYLVYSNWRTNRQRFITFINTCKGLSENDLTKHFREILKDDQEHHISFGTVLSMCGLLSKGSEPRSHETVRIFQE
jgi:hypothetical protein